MDDELRAAEHAAFHVGPQAGLALAAARREDLTRNDLRARWLRGVCLGALGRYGEAFELLDPTAGADEADDGRPDRLRSLTASTLGSLHRQLGRHAPAREHDLRALALAPPADVEALVEARLGLAADAVGLADVAEAAGQLEIARRTLAAVPGAGWRVRVRADWVAAEVSLLRGVPGRALLPSATATAVAERASAPRHVAKSLLFSSVARLLTGSPGEALADAGQAFDLAVQLGAFPLVWPAAGLLTDPAHALADMLGPDRRGEVLEHGAHAVRGISGGLPGELAVAWRSGADVHALLERAGALPPRPSRHGPGSRQRQA